MIKLNKIIFLINLVAIFSIFLYIGLSHLIMKNSSNQSYQIPEFKLPLDQKDVKGRTIIVQAKIGFGYNKDNQIIVNEVIKRKAQIQDKIQYVIASKKPEEINTAKRREQLKKDITDAINSIMTEGKIEDIHFKTFVISAISG